MTRQQRLSTGSGTGLPGGIERHADEILDKLWPRKDPEKLEEPALENITLPRRYDKMEEDVKKLITDYAAKNYIKKYKTVYGIKKVVGTKGVTSKLLVIEKQRFDAETGTYKTKKRTVLDLKASSISAASRLSHKAMPPKATDAIGNVLDTLSDLGEDELLLQVVADVIDAFWLIPNHPSERK